MSANGSPLAVFGGARATFGIDDGAEAQPVIQVALQDGNQIDLTDVEATNELSTDAREEARGKLQGLQVRYITHYLAWFCCADKKVIAGPTAAAACSDELTA